jgi:hypothetical protein
MAELGVLRRSKLFDFSAITNEKEKPKVSDYLLGKLGPCGGICGGSEACS